jgi:hypothetical protein
MEFPEGNSVDIWGYEGIYRIYDDGHVWSYPNKNGGSKHGRFLKAILKFTGYLQVTLSKENKVQHVNVHRLVATHFIYNDDLKIK